MARWSATVVAVIFGTAAVAGAQSTTIRVGGEQASSPYWNGNSNPLGDMPAADIRNVPVATANFVKSKWTFQQTLTDLNNAIRVVRMKMDRQPEYKKALDDEKTAYTAMQSARTNALADLKNNPSYTGAAQLHQNVSNLIADEQEAAKPDSNRLAGMAKLKLQYVKDNRKLEVAALDRDQPYQDARQKYVTAHSRVAAFEDAQSVAIATDPVLASVRKQVADTRIETLAARAFYDASIDARNIAVDYSLAYRGVDAYHGYGNNYGYGNYGYGVGPYGIGNGFAGRTVVRY